MQVRLRIDSTVDIRFSLLEPLQIKVKKSYFYLLTSDLTYVWAALLATVSGQIYRLVVQWTNFWVNTRILVLNK